MYPLDVTPEVPLYIFASIAIGVIACIIAMLIPPSGK
jgi:hypothetical protein